MPPPDAAKDAFIGQTNELANKTNECNSKFDELLKKVNKTLDDVGFFTRNIWFLNDEVDKLRDLVKQIGEKLKEMCEKVAKIVRGSVPVLSLYDAAFRWSADIQSKVSATSGTVAAPARLSMRGEWEGSASLAYFTVVVPLQVKAVDGVSATASSVSTWLAGVATANLKFMLEILEPVVEVLGKIIAGIAAAATVAGALEGIGRIADALGQSLPAITKILTDTANKIADSIEKANAALNVANDNGPFPGGKWPNPVTI